MKKNLLHEKEPKKSGHYFTNKGWAFFDASKGSIFAFYFGDQDVKGVEWWSKGDPEGPCFTEQDVDEQDNKPDLQKWVDNDELVALVDESCGGIIGYLNRAHADRILTVLNGWK